MQRTLYRLMLLSMLTLPLVTVAADEVNKQCLQLEHKFKTSGKSNTEELSWYMENCGIDGLLAIDHNIDSTSGDTADRRQHP